MKRANTAYRLQLIKEIAARTDTTDFIDPMARHIRQIMEDKPELNHRTEVKREFSGCYYDEHAGGWVNNTWHSK